MAQVEGPEEWHSTVMRREYDLRGMWGSKFSDVIDLPEVLINV